MARARVGFDATGLPIQNVTSLTEQAQINLGTLLLVLVMSVIAAVIVWRRAGSARVQN